MKKPVKAFVAHSFNETDLPIVRKILDYLDSFKTIGFEWEHAKDAESARISDKVIEKLEDKDIFIGIFTRKYRSYNTEVLRLGRLRIVGKNEIDLHTTSGWTLQESGYAIARKNRLILLVENGIQDIGGLHGDAERIHFSRENLEDAFLKLSETINKIVSENLPPAPNQDVSIPLSTDAPAEPQEQAETPPDQPTSPSDSIDQMIELITQGRTEDARKKLEEILASNQENPDYVNAFFEYHRASMGSRDAIDRLIAQKTSPALYFLAMYYQDAKEHRQASLYYFMLAEKAEDPIWKIRYAKMGSFETLKSSGKTEAEKEIKKFYFENNNGSLEQEAIYLEALLSIAKDNSNKYIAVLERLVEIDPHNTDFRFKLAHEYSNLKQTQLALFHYQAIIDIKPDASALNNIGVVLSQLDLDAMAVTCYQQALEKGESLAGANLAYKLIAAGFLTEAKKILATAEKQGEVHENVESAKAKLIALEKDEEDKKSKIFEKQVPHRAFMQRFSKAMLGETTTLKEGTWSTPYGELHIEAKEDFFIGVGTEKTLSFGALMRGININEASATDINERTIKLKFQKCNSAIFGEVIINDDKKHSLFSESAKTIIIRGIIIDLNNIEIAVYDGTSDVTFEFIRRKAL